jgi:hypothetical protein
VFSCAAKSAEQLTRGGMHDDVFSWRDRSRTRRARNCRRHVSGKLDRANALPMRRNHGSHRGRAAAWILPSALGNIESRNARGPLHE